jgi:hypothetical protein
MRGGSLIDSQVRGARYREPFLGDRRAWPLVHHDPDLPELSARIQSLQRSAAGPHVTLLLDGSDWVPLGIARYGTDVQEWMRREA